MREVITICKSCKCQFTFKEKEVKNLETLNRGDELKDKTCRWCNAPLLLSLIIRSN